MLAYFFPCVAFVTRGKVVISGNMAAMTSTQKYGLLASLYLAQGLPFGFLTQSLPVLLRDNGASLRVISLASLLFLPWALKFLWAPVLDRYYLPRLGRRRSWILPLQLGSIAAVLAISALDPAEHLWLFLLLVLCINFFSASQDIATDGMAVETLNATERGFGNGVQVAGYRAGMVLGGGLLLMVFDRIGWQVSFIAMAALLAVALIPITLYREPPKAATAIAIGRSASSNNSALLSFITSPGVLAWLGVLLLYKFGDGMSSGMVKLMLYDGGLTKADIGGIIGTGGFVAGLVGALFGGWLVPRLGQYRALFIFVLLQGTMAAAYGLYPLGLNSYPAVVGLVIFEHWVSGMHTAAMFAVMMAACRAGFEGSDYTVQASVFVAANGLGILISGFIAESFGYSVVHFLGGAAALLVAIPIVSAWRRGGFQAINNATVIQSK